MKINGAGSTATGNACRGYPRLYQTNSWDEAKGILEQYDIRYVVVGTLELQEYHPNQLKFQQHLAQVFQQGQVVIYEVP